MSELRDKVPICLGIVRIFGVFIGFFSGEIVLCLFLRIHQKKSDVFNAIDLPIIYDNTASDLVSLFSV